MTDNHHHHHHSQIRLTNKQNLKESVRIQKNQESQSRIPVQKLFVRGDFFQFSLTVLVKKSNFCQIYCQKKKHLLRFFALLFGGEKRKAEKQQQQQIT